MNEELRKLKEQWDAGASEVYYAPRKTVSQNLFTLFFCHKTHPLFSAWLEFKSEDELDKAYRTWNKMQEAS